MEIKTTMRPNYTFTKIAKIKNIHKNKIRIGKNVEKLEPSYINNRIVKWFMTLKNSMHVLQNVKHIVTTYFTTSYISKSIENISPHKNTNTNVHQSIIHTNYKIETIQISIN